MNTFRTPKGTELPISLIQGKQYLEVKFRILWWREENPKGRLCTELINATDSESTFKATVYDADGRELATGHGRETIKGFQAFLECAETAAIGRALCHCGYGTQFAADDTKLADAPIDKKTQSDKTSWPSTNSVEKTGPSAPQLKRLFAISKQYGWEHVDIKTYLTGLGLESSSDLSYHEYERLCSTIQSSPK